MKYTLVSREVIADCIETCVRRPVDGRRARDRRLRQEHARRHDGHLRAQRAGASTSTAAPSCPGNWKGKDLNIVSRRSRRSANSRPARMREEDFTSIERTRCPGDRLVRRHVHRQHDELGVRGAGHVAAVFVDDGQPRSRRRSTRPRESARVLVEAVKKDLKPRDIITRKSIENAVARDHGDRRLDQRGAALPGHRARGRGRMDDRRLRAHAQESAGDLRPEAGRPVRRDRSAPGRRHSAGA